MDIREKNHVTSSVGDFIIAVRKQQWKIALVFLLIVFLLVPQVKQEVLSENRLIVLNVGQGDAILIQTRDRKSILVDGGRDLSAVYRLSSHFSFFRRHLHRVILTHPDLDHLGGIYFVLQRFSTDQVIENGIEDSSPFLAAIRADAQSRAVAFAPAHFSVGTSEWQVLYPFENLSGRYFADTNMSSLVFLVTVNDQKILLTGDAPIAVEEKIIQHYPNLDVDILKAGHHGSRTSTSEKFLDHIRPEIALISAGENNPYGHPHTEVIQRLQKRRIQIFETRNGDIVCLLHQKIRCENRH